MSRFGSVLLSTPQQVYSDQTCLYVCLLVGSFVRLDTRCSLISRAVIARPLFNIIFTKFGSNKRRRIEFILPHTQKQYIKFNVDLRLQTTQITVIG